MWGWRGVAVVAMVVMVSAKPIVDPGLFVIQGVTTCGNGTGYCLLGPDCSVDVDFMADAAGGHCRGLREAFTPKIDFVCCMYNELGKASSEPPTTTVSSYTITDVFSIIDDHVANQQSDEIPEDVDPGSLIDIVGVVTDFTGIVGLVTRPWTGTYPTKATTPTTTPMTPPPPPTTNAPLSPATPVDPDAMVVVTQDPDVFTASTPEPTESYNEIPEDIIETQEEAMKENIETTTSPSATSLGQQVTTEATTLQTTPQTPPSTTKPVQAHPTVLAPLNHQEDPSSQGHPEAVEAEETQIHEQMTHMDEQGQMVHILESNSVSEHTLMLPGTVPSQDVYDGTNATIEITPSPPQDSLQEEMAYGDAMGLGGIDYEYYDNYPDQVLLQPVNQNICGFKGSKNYEVGSSSRILGGVVASTVEWCWVAAIMERRPAGDKYVCTGALVESNLVLTTASCLKRLERHDLSNYHVVLGDSNLGDGPRAAVQHLAIAELVAHPDYFTSGGAHSDDIGVLRVSGHATLSHNVCLVCLAQQDAVFPAQTCTVTGYGLGDIPRNVARDVRETVPSEGVLRQLSVPILGEEVCQKALHNITRSEILASSHSFLCAGGQDNAMACYSTLDGGSPLACEAGGRWFLAGLVSWSRDCTVRGVPNVYTRVASYTDWLQATHLRMMGFATHQVFSFKQHWIQERVDKINKEFAKRTA